jgi:hypothetical protein
MPNGWRQLQVGVSWFQEEGRYRIAAYSEFMPPPRLGLKPYGTTDGTLFSEDDPWGWPVTEYEEYRELGPGLEIIGRQILHVVMHLGQGQPAHGISQSKLEANPYWPEALAARAGQLAHERYVVLAPLALSRTQDDKGRVRWTLFGGSEQGPARPFWKSFQTAPGRPLADEKALSFLRRLLRDIYGQNIDDREDLRKAGLRILPLGTDAHFPFWREDLPAWTKPLLWRTGEPCRGIKYVLTFRPFDQLPEAIQRAYLAGDLHLLPFPGSLVFWGAPPYVAIQNAFPFAMQTPLLQSVARHEDPHGIRVPQSGWMHEPRNDRPGPDGHFGPVRNTYKRTHRWGRIHRHEDELVAPGEDHLAHVLFSNSADDVGLYGKPMARNVQIWDHEFCFMLDGPRATQRQIHEAARALAEGGLFGYRFIFPAMQVGRHEIYWHRPLIAFSSTRGEPVIWRDACLGYLTAYLADRPRLDRPTELWPRLLDREPQRTSLEIFDHAHDLHQYRTILNVRKMLDAARLFEPDPLPRSFARQLLTLPREETLDQWLASLAGRSNDPGRARALAEHIAAAIAPETDAPPPESLTFARTARRSFEVKYWNTIAFLSAGRFTNKDNADCVNDKPTQKLLVHPHRDLEALGDYLIDYYTKLIAKMQMKGKALVGDLPFRWETDFEFPWMGGWLSNQEGPPRERDIVVVIPGRDRRRAVIMADHYDTAYMEDRYEKDRGGTGARLAAAGADDNHSATAALMLGAEVFLELSNAGRLACDVWLVHLTGEEFPADCLGARHLTERFVERNLKIRVGKDKWKDLSRTRIQGVYVLDMVAHNNDRERDVFQIAPGTEPESAWLAYQAHLANEAWNAWAPAWNRRAARRDCGRGKRSADGKTIPDIALHPQLSGEVRPPYDPRSTLFNTDGQIFSDAGVPVVLFMENYDINRTGYHDTQDTLANIDLDYGAALVAIAIESVARAATEKPWPPLADYGGRRLSRNSR